MSISGMSWCFLMFSPVIKWPVKKSGSQQWSTCRYFHQESDFEVIIGLASALVRCSLMACFFGWMDARSPSQTHCGRGWNLRLWPQTSDVFWDGLLHLRLGTRLCRFTVRWEQCGAQDPLSFSRFKWHESTMRKHDEPWSGHINDHYLHFSLPLNLGATYFPSLGANQCWTVLAVL